MVGRQLSAKSSLVNEHLKAIHEAFHVEIYIKLKQPTNSNVLGKLATRDLNN